MDYSDAIYWWGVLFATFLFAVGEHIWVKRFEKLKK